MRYFNLIQIVEKVLMLRYTYIHSKQIGRTDANLQEAAEGLRDRHRLHQGEARPQDQQCCDTSEDDHNRRYKKHNFSCGASL